jgi:archaemetzincin
MKIGILQIGQTDAQTVNRVQENLKMIFPKTRCILLPDNLPIPQEAFNSERQQHRSDLILQVLHDYAENKKDLDRLLGIVDTDIFVPDLNFVFGEAEYPGKTALISLWRLKPEFYKKKPDPDLLAERSTKEAVHEIGHTLGLKHCSNPFCVMYFSNSIFETDRKQSLFCNKCFTKIQAITGKRGQEP